MTDNIIFTDHPAADLDQFISQNRYSKIGIIVDDNTGRHCLPLLKTAGYPVCTIPNGEEYKNLQTCQSIWNFLTDQHFDRHSLVIIVGGGVLGDMAGFCAATYKRGVDFILIPTTLLSQVDASIGGKLGIDFNHFKNHIGLFQTPGATIISPVFLKTLPDVELKSGFAEIIKHNLISKNNFWDELKSKEFSRLDLTRLIRHSISVKSEIVNTDPTEKGLRKILNAGHTIGHAIETHLLMTGRKIAHGEAVAAGLLTESFLAHRSGLLAQVEFDQITTLIRSTYSKLGLTDDDDLPIAALTLQDKKNSNGKIKCVLLEKIGQARWDCEIALEDVKDALLYYRNG